MDQKDRDYFIQQYLGIDVADPAIRRRAWQRLQVFREVIAECEADGNHDTAEFLSRIFRQAMLDQDAIAIALVAGPNVIDDTGSS